MSRIQSRRPIGRKPVVVREGITFNKVIAVLLPVMLIVVGMAGYLASQTGPVPCPSGTVRVPIEGIIAGGFTRSYTCAALTPK